MTLIILLVLLYVNGILTSFTLTGNQTMMILLLYEFYLIYPYYRESNPENIMVSCGAQQVNADTPSPMDPGEVRLQATEVIQQFVAAHLYFCDFLKGFAPRELPLANSTYPNSWGEQWSPFWSRSF